MTINRRDFIGSLGACAAFASAPSTTAKGASTAEHASHRSLTPWTEGTLEFHHISTGRGNSTFIICPDGTTILIDAGAIYDAPLYTIEPKPDASRRPGEWIARYIKRRLSAGVSPIIDYAMLTHFHGDHIGEAVRGLPMSRKGDFQLTGITDVAEVIPIGILIDRDYPEYTYPQEKYDATFQNYRQFVNHRLRAHESVSALEVGSFEQIRLKRRRDDFSDFRVNNVARNGIVASRSGKPQQQFPHLSTLLPYQLPSENMCSLALRITFGNFAYYSGGDLTNDTDFGRAPWRDIESVVAKSVGPVTMAVANHHGYVNGMGPDAVSILRPQAFVVFAWDSAHPTISPLFNMLSRDLYPGDRRVYATAVKAENMIATRDIAKLASTNGHVIVRVTENGARFEVLIVDNSDERDLVKTQFGPFLSRQGDDSNAESFPH